MASIKHWLADLGLQRYLSAFEDAEIDVDTLPDLMESDLKELGLPLGPRRKIWAAIARMSDPPPAPAISATNPDPIQTGAFSTPGKAQAERRHLTVMFVDLVGSTEMVGRMDAEDMGEVFTLYQDCVASVVESMNGYVATLMGDGVMCYFGWPYANEDDSERAVRAGLAIIDAARQITTPDGASLAVRVGVATGVVIVGDLIGNGARQEAAVVGETPNLAARLQSIAEPNQLIVPDDTLPLLGSMFELTPLGAQNLKGVSRRVKAFVVRGEATNASRFSARRSGQLTPIVGRENEIASIMSCWSEASSGRGRLVVLSGEAGIGKSRLTQAIVDKIAANDGRYAFYQCSPYHTDSAFYPIIQPICTWAKIAPNDTTDQKLDKIETLVNGTQQDAALLATLLGVDTSSRYEPSALTPTQQRAHLINLLTDLLFEQVREIPMLIILEDLHWIDPTTLDLINSVLQALPEQKLLMLITTRLANEHDFSAVPKLTRIVLDRLDTAMIHAVVGKLTAGKALPAEILDTIVRRTDGVPLFVEELTKSILESGALKEDQSGYVVDPSITDEAIPATLHDSLLARLDRLDGTREIAQIASCIGREFTQHLLSRICDLPHETLATALETLVDAELIHQHQAPPRVSYQFKHALVRDAAYESLLKRRRAKIHERILGALEGDDATPAELLAKHAEAAQMTERAITLWETAAKGAIARPAYQECEAHLKRAIALNAAKVAEGDRKALARAVSLKVQLFVAQSPGTGFWADDTVANLEEALALADRLGDTPLRGDIVYGLVLSTYFRGSLERSIASADELNLLAQASGDDAQLLVAKRLAGVGRLMTGQVLQARPYLNQAEELCDRVAEQNLAVRFGHDPIVGVNIYQSMLNTFRGATQRAQDYRIKAEERAKKVAHTNTTCTMYGLALFCAHIAGDVAAERRHLTNMRLLVEEHAVTASHLWAEVAVALLKLADGQTAALDEYYRAEKAMVAANIRLLVPGNRVLAARRIKALGLSEEARAMADAADSLMQETGERSWLPDLYRLRAEFALDHSDRALAQEHLTRAISIARHGGATLWELRASIDLARIYSQTQRPQQAIGLLEPLCNQIGPQDCLPERAAARAVLESCARS